MSLFHIGKPFRRRGLGLDADRRHSIAKLADFKRDLLDEGPKFADAPDRHEAENRRLADAAAHDRLAAAQHHQLGQFDHHLGVGLAGLEEGVARHRDDFGIPQRHDVARVGRIGDQRHFAGRFAGTDHAQQMNFAAGLAPKRAQSSRAHIVKLFGGVAGRKQGRAARQRKPGRVFLHARLAEQPRERRILRNSR